MKNGKNKYNTMLLALCMVLTAFVAVVSIPVSANEMSNDFEIFWVNGWMENDPDAIPDDELIVFNYDDNNNRPYFLGDNNAEIELTIYNRNGAANTDDVSIDLLIGSGGGSIIDDIPVNRWPVSNDYDGFADDERIDDNPGGGGGNLPYFEIDIATSGAVNTIYEDALEIRIHFDDGTGADTDTFSFDLYVSSVFDYWNNGIPASIDAHDDLPGIDETPPDDSEFEAGVNMQEGEITLQEWAPFSIDEVHGTLSSMPSGITLSGDPLIAATAVIPSPGNPFSLFWRFNVASSTSPGVYNPDLQLMFDRSDTGETITESARATEMIVDYTPRLQASLASGGPINQNDQQVTLSVIFHNTGNVALDDVYIRPEPDFDWLDVKFHHYENDVPVFETQVMIGNLGIGEASAAQTVIVSTNIMLPNGSHRVPFAWSGWVYENGDTGDASRWVMMGGYMWDQDAGIYPEVERLYEDDNENRMFDDGTDTPVEPVWDGAFVDFDVIDANGLTWTARVDDDVEAGRDDLPGMGPTDADVTFTTITVTLTNLELVRYKDLVVEMGVGPGTPFFDPADHDATRLMMDPGSATSIDGDSEAEIEFTVDVNMAWWQVDSDDTAHQYPETYMVTLFVDATNDHDEVRVEDEQIQAQVNIVGFGPELFASAVSDDGIKPGESFMLTITITNYGDDIAREVDAYLRADFVSGWQIVDEYTSATGSYGEEISESSYSSFGTSGSSSSFNWSRGNDIRPGEIGIDNVPQIVELHDWITRRETPPQGIILWMHTDRLEPGDTWSVTFEMISDVNMVEGMVYYETLELYYVDSNGLTYGPNDDDYHRETPPQSVLLRTGKGEKFDADAVDFSVVLYAIIFLIIAFIVFLIGYALGGRGGGRPREEEPAPFEDYEQEYVPPPEEDMPMDEDMPPDEPEDELGPPPEPEEDIKPPE